MHYLIRTLTGRGRDTALETEYSADQLTMGSGEKDTVQLPGLPGQLRFNPTGDGGASFSAKGLKATIGGDTTAKAKVAVGDQLKVPGYALEVIAAPTGFDFGLQVVSEGVSYADSMDIGERLWNMRRASWILATLVLVLCFVIPLGVLLSPDTAETLRDAPLPDDGMWSSGPLVSAHATAGIAEDCQSCHTTPFVMVEDQACLDCHRDIQEHVDIGIHGADDFSDVRCATCHREHNEPTTMVRMDNWLCVDCHAEPARFPKAEGMAEAHQFTPDEHPEFRIDLLVPKGRGGSMSWVYEPRRLNEPGLKEQSGLKFNHDVHLNPAKVKNLQTNEALVCNTCHQLEADDEHFAPITMDGECRSCHELTFDKHAPKQELPHGNTEAAIVAMEAHYIRQFTDPDLRAKRSSVRGSDSRRRKPGSKRNEGDTCNGTPFQCGRKETERQAGLQFSKTGCVTCHNVVDSESDNLLDRYYVQPVKITNDWYTGNRFDHRAHMAFQGENEDEVCMSCHEVKVSAVAEDILIPGRDNCLECHDDNQGDTTVYCVSCHAFHLPAGTMATKSRNAGLIPQNPHSGTEGE
ncbi:MAG: hypothetical protein HKN19_04535 [Halioglobus sp.]|nr:hypothetical protein [Halioglobus sp.]